MTAATVTLAPGPADGPEAGANADDDHTRPSTRADFAQWQTELTATGSCHHPVRMRGQIRAIDLATGEVRPVYSTAAEPGRVLELPCGNRRESVCPSCSAVYKRDARQLVRAGLAGGKGIPESIAAHPCVFATFTAPSFGPVHARRMRGKTVLPCRPRRDAAARRCPHGRDISCPARHSDDDPRLGRALCGDCYDYTAAVLFNAHAGQLWRRFTTYLPRRLAAAAGLTLKAFREQLAVRYVKVTEYQARGVVHFHAVIRLDHAGDDYQPPGPFWTADLLCQAIEQAAAAVVLAVALGPGQPGRALTFGPQTDTRPIRPGPALPATGTALPGQAVANYIAKYVTKTLTATGLPDRRIKLLADIDRLRCHRHYKQMMTTAWHLADDQAAGDDRYRKWAHALGYGGHCVTKSRRYSVTFGQLRRARAEHRRLLRNPQGERDPWGRPLDETVVLVLKVWSYAGIGCTAAPDAELALASAARARAHGQAQHVV